MRPLCAILALAVLTAGCGPETSRPETTGGETETPEAYTDLPGYEGDPFAGFAGVVSIDLPAPSDTASRTPEEEVPGTSGPFSIQIIALGDEATARGVAESAAAESGMPAFVDREGRYWKVRLGSFPDRASAASRLPDMEDLGFSDAWVVRRGDG